MDASWIKRPSPAFVIAMIALFVGLGGTAGAVATQIVPLAKRALVADKAKTATTAKTALSAENAKKLGGQTSAQLVSQAVQQASQAPGPASTAAGLVTTKTASAQIPAGGGAPYEIACDSGQKVVGGGFLADNAVIIAVANAPVSDSSWGIGLINMDDAAPANVNLYAICIR
jgi:hypothetical protein